MSKITSRFPRNLKRLKCKTSFNYQCGGKCQPLRYNCKKQTLGMAKDGLAWLKAVEERKARIAKVNARRGDRKQYAVDDLGNVSRGTVGRDADPGKRVVKGAIAKSKEPAFDAPQKEWDQYEASLEKEDLTPAPVKGRSIEEQRQAKLQEKREQEQVAFNRLPIAVKRTAFEIIDRENDISQERYRDSSSADGNASRGDYKSYSDFLKQNKETTLDKVKVKREKKQNREALALYEKRVKDELSKANQFRNSSEAWESVNSVLSGGDRQTPIKANQPIATPTPPKSTPAKSVGQAKADKEIASPTTKTKATVDPSLVVQTGLGRSVDGDSMDFVLTPEQASNLNVQAKLKEMRQIEAKNVRSNGDLIKYKQLVDELFLAPQREAILGVFSSGEREKVMAAMGIFTRDFKANNKNQAVKSNDFVSLRNIDAGKELRKKDDNAEFRDAVEGIRLLLSKAPKHEGSVYRGIRFSGKKTEVNRGDREQFIADLKAKGEIDLDAFSSFSTRQSVAEGFAGLAGGGADGTTSIIFRVKDNKSGVNVSPFSKVPDESEVLVPKNTRYKVVNIEENEIDYKKITGSYRKPTTSPRKNIVYVDLEELPVASKPKPNESVSLTTELTPTSTQEKADAAIAPLEELAKLRTDGETTTTPAKPKTSKEEASKASLELRNLALNVQIPRQEFVDRWLNEAVPYGELKPSKKSINEKWATRIDKAFIKGKTIPQEIIDSMTPQHRKSFELLQKKRADWLESQSPKLNNREKEPYDPDGTPVRPSDISEGLGKDGRVKPEFRLDTKALDRGETIYLGSKPEKFIRLSGRDEPLRVEMSEYRARKMSSDDIHFDPSSKMNYMIDLRGDKGEWYWIREIHSEEGMGKSLLDVAKIITTEAHPAIEQWQTTKPAQADKYLRDNNISVDDLIKKGKEKEERKSLEQRQKASNNWAKYLVQSQSNMPKGKRGKIAASMKDGTAQSISSTNYGNNFAIGKSLDSGWAIYDRSTGKKYWDESSRKDAEKALSLIMAEFGDVPAESILLKTENAGQKLADIHQSVQNGVYEGFLRKRMFEEDFSEPRTQIKSHRQRIAKMREISRQYRG